MHSQHTISDCLKYLEDDIVCLSKGEVPVVNLAVI